MSNCIKLVTYPGPGFADESLDYRVQVEGKSLFVHPVRVSAMSVNQIYKGFQRPLEQTELAAFVQFDFEGSVCVKVISAMEVFKAQVRPTAKNVCISRNRDELTFEINKPGQYTLEINGLHKALHIFANPMEKDKPDPKAEHVQYIAATEKPGHSYGLDLQPGKDTLYFGPGIHSVGQITLASSQSVYIDGGAIVYGSILGYEQDHLRVYGRGILDGSRFHRETIANLLLFKGCNDIEVDGVILRDSAVYNFSTANCRNIHVNNIKILSWRYNSDGIDYHNSSSSLIENSFLRCFDDCIVMKGQKNFQGYDSHHAALTDITVENCVIWCDWGRALEIGAETVGDEIARLTFHNCDIIHFSFIACDVQGCGDAPIHDVCFEDIRIEDPIDSLVDPRLMEIFLRSMVWVPDVSLGRAYDITFKNIDYKGLVICPCRFIGFDTKSDVQDIHLENITLNGRTMTTLNDLIAPVIVNSFVGGLTLDGKAMDLKEARYESEEDTCHSYLVGNGAFIVI